MTKLKINLKIVDGRMVVDVNEMKDVLTMGDADLALLKNHIEEFDGDYEKAMNVLHKWAIQDFLFRTRTDNKIKDECIYDHTSNEEAFQIQDGRHEEFSLEIPFYEKIGKWMGLAFRELNPNIKEDKIQEKSYDMDKINNMSDTDKMAQGLNIHQGVFSNGRTGKLLSDQYLNTTVSIGEAANIFALEQLADRSDEPFDFIKAGVEEDLLNCPVDGYNEFSSIFVDNPKRAQEAIEFLKGDKIDDVDDVECDDNWYDAPCDSAARGLYWGLREKGMEDACDWVIKYLQDKIDNELF